MNIKSINVDKLSFNGLNAQRISKSVSKMSNTVSDKFLSKDNSKLAKLIPVGLVPLSIIGISKNSKNKEDLPFAETPVIAENIYDDRTLNLLAELKKDGIDINIAGGIDRHTAGGLTSIDKNLLRNKIDEKLKESGISAQKAEDYKSRLSFCGNVDTTAVATSNIPDVFDKAFDVAGDIQTATGLIKNTSKIVEGIKNEDKHQVIKGVVGVADNTLGVAAREATIAAATGVAASVGGTIGGFVEGIISNGKSTKTGEKIGATVAAAATQAITRIEWETVRDKIVDTVTEYIESPKGQENIAKAKEFGKEVFEETKNTMKNIQEDVKDKIEEIKDSELYKETKEKVKEAGSKFLSGISSFFQNL